MRVVLDDVEIDGHPIAKGQSLIVWTKAANYDESAFPDSETFNPRRTPNRHLGFCVGAHFCLGAPLARLELRIALGLLLERLPQLQREAGQSLAPVDSPFLLGVKHLPLVVV
jgi:cytochrome P450